MDFVIPVALGELLKEKYILTAAELNRHRANALASPKLCTLGLPAGISCVLGLMIETESTM